MVRIDATTVIIRRGAMMDVGDMIADAGGAFGRPAAGLKSRAEDHEVPEGLSTMAAAAEVHEYLSSAMIARLPRLSGVRVRDWSAARVAPAPGAGGGWRRRGF